MTRMRRAAMTALVAVLAAPTLVGCHGKTGGASPASSGDPAAVPALPRLVLKDDTADALFTWIDDRGDFHVTLHPSDVPEASRSTVRVVVAGKGEGTAESVYVADLRTKGADGAYVVTTMARSSWDELGAAKRKARLEALAPSASPSSAPVPSGVSAAPSGEVSAVIYGASWCGPCHQAEALLRSLGVKVTKKDIEQMAGASEEMHAVLRRAHRSDGSIPVIDLAGQVFIGYSEGALRAAVQRLRSATL